MNEVTERILSFSKEINEECPYNSFGDAVHALSTQKFPITDDMNMTAKKTEVGRVFEALATANFINSSFAMDMLQLLNNADQKTFEELSCF